MYSSRVIFPSATSSRRSMGFMQSITPTHPVQSLFAISSPAIFAIFFRVPKRGTSDNPDSAMIDASPSLSFFTSTSSQYFMRTVLSLILCISSISPSEILSRSATISCFSFLDSFDLFFGNRSVFIFFLKAFLSNGEMGTSTPSGISPTSSLTLSYAFSGLLPKHT